MSCSVNSVSQGSCVYYSTRKWIVLRVDTTISNAAASTVEFNKVLNPMAIYDDADITIVSIVGMQEKNKSTVNTAITLLPGILAAPAVSPSSFTRSDVGVRYTFSFSTGS